MPAPSKLGLARAAATVLFVCTAVTCAVSQEVPNVTLPDGTSFDDLLGSNRTRTGPARQAESPDLVVVSSVTPRPADGQPAQIVLRNLGERVANLTGWKLSDSNPVREPYELGRPGCERQAILESGATTTLTTASARDPCGFEFSISGRDSVRLFDAGNNEVSKVAWASVREGATIHLMPDGRFREIAGGGNILDTMREMGVCNTFLEALEFTGLDGALAAPSDPDYAGPVLLDDAPVATPNFPWWFGFERSRSPVLERARREAAAAAQRPTSKGVADLGPFTVFCPTDAAFEQTLQALGGFAGPLPRQALFESPEMTDIVLYHILPGNYNSTSLRNGTAYVTAQLSELFGVLRVGRAPFFLHDACVDFPTPDRFDCNSQKEFGKCQDPFMVAPAPGWQGGYCQRTCGRCSCEADVTCGTVVLQDVQASNGVVHAVDRLLFPPPVFKDVAAPAPMPEEDDAAAPPVRRPPPGAPRSGRARDLPVDEPDSASLAELLPSARRERDAPPREPGP
ncbi:unnamed protein product [Pedinophyceae sp. YPF-701]|nr:unnamed protein product [Pedinophyceae sp. YPF-701]